MAIHAFWKLGDDFHEEGLLVHNDQRSEHFIFTEHNPRKTLLVDLDRKSVV